VVATAAGVGGNADPGTVTLLASAVAGVDTVVNNSAIVGGSEAESDAALRARFVAYLASLARATRSAVEFAISAVEPGLSWSILEGQRPDGSAAPSVFTVVVDDGTGTPSDDLIARVSTAVDEYRALGVEYSVVAPVLRQVDHRVLMQIETCRTRRRRLPPRRGGAGGAARPTSMRCRSAPDSVLLPAERRSRSTPAPLVTGIVITYDIDGKQQDVAPSLRQAVRVGLISVV
jgi:hypothetical protein